MSHTYVLTSKSPLKVGLIKKLIKEDLNNGYDFMSFDTGKANIPPQPVGENILKCAVERISYTIDENQLSNGTIIISIENGIRKLENGNSVDVCCVVLKCASFITQHESEPIKFPTQYYDKAESLTDNNYPLKDLGFCVSVGELISLQDPYIDPKNWMADSVFGGFDRKEQIMEPLQRCYIDYKKHILKMHILEIDNFKPGVVFKDLSNIIKEPTLLRYLVDCMVYDVRKNLGKVDKIIGLDARGFIYGPLLAYKIGAGFVMARKKGKLPLSEKSIDYTTEYSEDTIEIMPNIIEPTDNILIVDDLIATGGTVCAAKELVKVVGGNPIGVCCVLQVDGLINKAIKKLNGTKLISVLK